MFEKMFFDGFDVIFRTLFIGIMAYLSLIVLSLSLCSSLTGVSLYFVYGNYFT